MNPRIELGYSTERLPNPMSLSNFHTVHIKAELISAPIRARTRENKALFLTILMILMVQTPLLSSDFSEELPKSLNPAKRQELQLNWKLEASTLVLMPVSEMSSAGAMDPVDNLELATRY